MPELLLATSNSGKAAEYRWLLRDIGYHIVTLAEQGIKESVEERGNSYEQNAQTKAIAYAQLSGLTTLADDSGLEVDALHGEPGIYSARFAGENASDSDKTQALLTKLAGIPWNKRTARFKCVIAIATAKAPVKLCYGECQGIISLEVSGQGGFGYDPVFYLPQFGKTMAELPSEVKNKISHRARAAKKARQVLQQLKTRS